VLAGGECRRTQRRARRAGRPLTWRQLPDGVAPTRIVGDAAAMSHPEEEALGLVRPAHLYALFETAWRARTGEAVDEHLVRISELWSRFSEVAAGNPYAAVQRRLSAEEIRTPGPGNRMVSLPYPK